MKHMLPNLSKRFRRDESGVTLVMVTLFIVVLFGFAALSLDVGNVYREQRKLNNATDAGALAGVLKFPDQTKAINDARAVAFANGATGGEIQNGARNGFPGDIQVGWWDVDNRIFVAGATPVNAIRVPARRTVPLYFGKVVGLGVMKPAVSSVALVGKYVTPYGIPICVVTNLSVGQIFTNNWWNSDPSIGCPKRPGGAGNWGVIYLCADPSKITGHDATVTALTNSGCFAYVGETVPVGTGFDGIADAFQSLYTRGETVILPVTTDFPNGVGKVTILDFIAVQLLDAGSGGGNTWVITMKLLAKGVNPNPRRVLVE